MTHPSTIAFIGGGNMARCVLGGLVAQGMPPASIRSSQASGRFSVDCA